MKKQTCEGERELSTWGFKMCRIISNTFLMLLLKIHNTCELSSNLIDMVSFQPSILRGISAHGLWTGGQWSRCKPCKIFQPTKFRGKVLKQRQSYVYGRERGKKNCQHLVFKNAPSQLSGAVYPDTSELFSCRQLIKTNTGLETLGIFQTFVAFHIIFTPSCLITKLKNIV